MINSDFKDSDGFRLQFEESIAEDEKKFYMKTFSRVDDVTNDRIHCTTCDTHIGTAPISEKIIRTHQILNVTQCNKCFAFYNSGEFGKGEDGSEYYCRWCGQGGEVFCCSSCPYVFCNKCIRDNLSEDYVKEIEENDDWSCFVCNKEILKRLRAQHWALRNFMNKQLEKIQKVNINSEDELNNLLNEDLTTCCPKKKRKLPLPKPAPAPIKRPLNGMQVTSQPPAKKPTLSQQNNKIIKMPVNASFSSKPLARQIIQSAKKPSSEVVCTPDIMGLFNDKAGTSSAPPPLAMRQIQRQPAPTRGTTPNAILHTVNGYQIDLNQASRQEIFRLPNGKLIQVRKQTNPTAPPPSRLASPNMSANIVGRGGAQFTIRPPAPQMPLTPRMMRPNTPAMTRIRTPAAQQRFSFSDGRVVSGTNSTQNAAPAPATTTVASTIFTQQNGSISVARAPQPDTPFGKSKTAFEDRIIQGLEICQHTINKMITLTNSTSFKSSRSFADLKDLYIHLQYLFTYTSGKFKTLQDNLVTGMQELAENDDSLKEKQGDDDDLEVVTQKVDVVEVLSDNEEEAENAKKALTQNTESTISAKSILSEKESDLEVPPTLLVEAVLEEVSSKPPPKKVINQTELLASLNIEVDDEQLKKRTAVKVERLEDSKDSVIKQYMIAIQQRRDIVNEEEDVNDDEQELDDCLDFPLVPEVVLEESLKENEEDEISKERENEEVTEEKETSEKSNISETDVVEIPSDDEETANIEKENDTANSSEINKDESEQILAKLNENDLKIDNAPPLDLMEVDTTVENGDHDVGDAENIDEAEESSKVVEEDSVIELDNSAKDSQENGDNEEIMEESKIDEKEIEEKASESPIDNDKELESLINSMDDEPMAPPIDIDMEIPEALG